MSISSYSELQTAMGNWTDRSDLSSRLPEFIALWEAKINRRLRVRQQITSTSITMSSGSGTLPTDYLEWKRVTWTGNPTRELEYVTPSFLQSVNASGNSADPLYFTIEGSTIKVGPLDNTSLTLLYAQQVPALSNSNTANWLLTACPDAYLFGSLTMMATYTSDAANGSAWNALSEAALDELWRLNFSQTGTVAQRPSGVTP